MGNFGLKYVKFSKNLVNFLNWENFLFGLFIAFAGIYQFLRNLLIFITFMGHLQFLQHLSFFTSFTDFNCGKIDILLSLSKFIVSNFFTINLLQ